MGRLPLFYDSLFYGNTLVGGPGSMTGAADNPSPGTASQWADLDGFTWQTQGSLFLSSSLLETLNNSAATTYAGALARPSTERCRDQMIRATIGLIGRPASVWMLYLRFNTAGSVNYYRFRLHYDGRIYADAIQPAVGTITAFVNTTIPNWDNSIVHDFEVSAIGTSPGVLTITITDPRDDSITYQTTVNDFLSSLTGIGGYAVGENDSVPGGPFSRIRLYGEIGQSPHTYDAWAKATVVLTATVLGPPHTRTKTASASMVLIAQAQSRLAEDWPVSGSASLTLRARARVAGVAHASVILTATAVRQSRGVRAITLTATASSHVAHHKLVAAQVKFFPLASAVKVIQRIRVSQLPVEVLRSRYTDTSLARPEVTQICIEVLVPYVHAGTFYAKVATATVVVTALASNVRPAVSGDADPEVVLTATAASPGVVRRLRTASGSLVLTATGSSLVGNFGAGSVTVVLTATAVEHSPNRPTFSSVAIRLTARARVLVSGISFGDDYLGRFQQGQDVPLWVVIRDQRGSPTDPMGNA